MKYTPKDELNPVLVEAALLLYERYRDAVLNDEDINGADAVESIAAFVRTAEWGTK